MNAAPVPRMSRAPDPWARRAAFACLLSSIPLILFGGSVTTLGAGMAVDGWLIAEGHFLLFFPAEKWFRDTATFVEHTHRLWGMLVGLCALACVALAWLRAAPRGARLAALVALVAVCAQGALGGLRVLENAPELAFLHGAAAQLVFAILCANALVFSRAWRAEEGRADGRRAAPLERHALASSALVAAFATYAQVVLGAWYRHGLRPAPGADSALRFALHGGGALVVLFALTTLWRRGALLQAAEGGLPGGLARALRWLPTLLVLQLVLGGLAWAGFRPGAIGPAEWALSIAHVLGGAFLFADVAVIALWARRLARRADVQAPSALAVRTEGR